MSSAIYILLGFGITYATYFLVIWGFTSFYYWIVKEQIDFLRDLKIASILAATGLASTILGMIIFSSLGIYTFALAMVGISLASYYLVIKYFWKFSTFDAVINATTLAIILNPAWLRLIGIL